MSADVRTALAECIRSYSREGRLFSSADLPEARRVPPGEWMRLADETAAEHPDIRAIAFGEWVGHYSERFMTAPYAGLLAGRSADPLALVVQTVRDQSQSYPRPVPVSFFAGPPFDFTPEDLSACLDRIAARPDSADIARATTSAGNTFLYSTRHLQPDHAAALAEWIDIGQFDNP
jgi:hypothetical protein